MRCVNSVTAVFLSISVISSAVNAVTGVNTDALMRTISALDKQVFDAFNRCDDAAQLAKHESFFAEDVEFYHDTGGVTWNRATMIENTKKYACGNYRRELVEGSLRVYSVKEFGAIEHGTHRFCEQTTNKCEGLADFTMVWKLTDGKWQITRVLSYGHRPINPAVKDAQ